MNARKPEELQRAHDILVAVILKEIDIGLREDGEAMQLIVCSAATLCWALNHDHQPAFTKLLEMVEREAEKRGYTLHDYGN